MNLRILSLCFCLCVASSSTHSGSLLGSRETRSILNTLTPNPGLWERRKAATGTLKLQKKNVIVCLLCLFPWIHHFAWPDVKAHLDLVHLKMWVSEPKERKWSKEKKSGDITSMDLKSQRERKVENLPVAEEKKCSHFWYKSSVCFNYGQMPAERARFSLIDEPGFLLHRAFNLFLGSNVVSVWGCPGGVIHLQKWTKTEWSWEVFSPLNDPDVEVLA